MTLATRRQLHIALSQEAQRVRVDAQWELFCLGIMSATYIV